MIEVVEIERSTISPEIGEIDLKKEEIAPEIEIVDEIDLETGGIGHGIEGLVVRTRLERGRGIVQKLAVVTVIEQR